LGRKLRCIFRLFLFFARGPKNVPQTLFTSFVIAFVLAVAVGDLIWQRIPRHLATGAFFLGIAYHAIFGGILSALLASLFGFAAGVVFFRLGAIGGGDVKLLTAVGALLGLPLWGRAMFIAVLVAAVMALLTAIYKGALIRTLRNCFVLATSLATRGFAPHETIHLHNELAVRAPFGVAAAAGTLFVLLNR
jgi:prepilin peptidase CpaA